MIPASAQPATLSRIVVISEEVLRDNGTCPVGYRCFLRLVKSYGRDHFELQELLDILASRPVEDREELAHWHANWLLCTFGGYDTITEVDSLDCSRDYFTAGSLVVRGDAKVAGRLIAHHVHVGGDLAAGEVRLSGRLDVGGDLQTVYRAESAAIRVGGNAISEQSFLRAASGDVVVAGSVSVKSEVTADTGTVKVGGDVTCGEGVYARAKEIGGSTTVLELPALPELSTLIELSLGGALASPGRKVKRKAKPRRAAKRNKR